MGTVALILVVTFTILVIMDVPIAVAITLASFVAIIAEGSDPNVVLASKMVSGVHSFALLAIPFFILSGHLMGKGGLARRLICLLYTSPSPRDATLSRMPSSA